MHLLAFIGFVDQSHFLIEIFIRSLVIGLAISRISLINNKIAIDFFSVEKG